MENNFLITKDKISFNHKQNNFSEFNINPQINNNKNDELIQKLIQLQKTVIKLQNKKDDLETLLKNKRKK